jgi:CHAD domain-containing protein
MKDAGQTSLQVQRKAASAAELDCATAFQKVALDCIARIKLHHSSACAGDAEAVHQIRVAITRLRAAVSFFAPITVDAEWRRLKQELVWLNGSLGAARDSDVVVEYARRPRYRAWAQRMIGEDIDAHRTRDHRRMVRCLRSLRFHDLIEAMSGWIRGGPWLQRWERTVRRKSARSLKAYCARELNRWRRRLIRGGRQLFRYMIEALTLIIPLFDPGEYRHVHRPAKRLQRSLGDLRDLKRFAKSALSAQTDHPGEHRPPGYRRQRQKLRSAAVSAYRSLKDAGVC